MEGIEVKKYNSVGGWLSLLCFMLILGSPIRNIFTIYTEFAGTSSYFKDIKGLENFVYIESITIIILMILSIWSGISLLLIKPYAVKLTKIYLILFLINGLVQNLFPEIAGLDAEFIKGMEYQMKVNTTSAVLVFGIWFTYLSVSERVENTYPNSKSIENSNIENQKYNDFASKLNSTFSKIKNFYNNQILVRIKKIEINNLNSDEIIIASIIVATLIALILGYNFGETYYFYYNGNRGSEEHHSYTEFHFNYLLGIASFIIFGGISNIYLNRKNKKNE
jgi:ribosomal protein L20A (L18A)